jgi:hypothetical protein
MAVRSIEDETGLHCVDLIGLADEVFTFKVFRKEPEEGRWRLVADFSHLRFGSEEDALREAARTIPWLGPF